MAKSIKKLLKSFTLIELIIVIAIIAVLGATAFLLLTQWMSKGRDAQRISDLSTIKTALDIALSKNDELPLPDENNVLLYSGTKILNQGKFGDDVVKSIGTLNKVPKDRVNGLYEYSLLENKKSYMVRAIMENQVTLENGFLFAMNTAIANDLVYRYVGKSLKGILVQDKFIYLPSMFITGYVNGQYDLLSGTNVFQGNKVGEYISGGIVINSTDNIIAMLTGLGLSLSDANSIISSAIPNHSPVGIIPQEPVQPVKNCLTISSINATLTPGTPTEVDQIWQDTDITAPCYIKCINGTSFNGTNCVSDAGTVLLIHGDNINNMKTFVDSSVSNATITTIGDTKQVSPAVGSGFARFNGTTDYLSVANSTDFDIGLNNEPFTVEMWIQSDKTGTQTFFGKGGGFAGWNSTNGHQYILIQTSSTTYFQFWQGSALGQVVIPGNVFSDGKLNHCAVVYDGSNIRIYKNGINIGSTSSANFAKPSGALNFQVGKNASDTNFFNGFIDELRVSKGVARYTDNFTPTRTKFEVDSSTKLLMHFDANGNTFIDQTGKTITPYGSVHQIKSVFGNGIVFFDGAGDRLSLPSRSDYSFGTGEFTIDFWVHPLVTTNISLLLKSAAGGCPSGQGYSMGINVSKFYAGIDESCNDFTINGLSNVIANRRYHLALVRDKNVIKFFVDGILQGTKDFTLPYPTNTTILEIGGSSYFGTSLNGYIEEYRIIKGKAARTDNFQVPSAPY